MKDKESTAILGGFFDPPHTGHLAMAQMVLDMNLAKSVSLMPCYSHNFGKKMTSPKHRIAMCCLCARDGISIDSFEVDNKLEGKTLSIVKALNIEGYRRPTLVIGSDNASCFKDWYRYEELLIKAKFIIVPREDYEITSEIKKIFRHPHIILDKKVDTVSSTRLREWIKGWWKDKCEEKEISTLPPGILEYIKENNLYK